MSNHQHEDREAAEKAFLDSLNALQERLQLVEDQKAASAREAERQAIKTAEEEKATFTLHDLEEAVADIDEFFKELHKPATEDSSI
ncbi:hypothetical protein NG799_24475 [Laspinema sp. D1]|uniref:Uncharacterized protein n=1 Tax=Laspinema palackyanum D2a TaxID=2953684 RepID=A0ABT2MXL2_9CYAN|nr:hypothetical protein [Laspinema sp. D2b]MCT7969475.1 hypothetical protein [Laspinema sp. D2a]